MQRAGCVIRLQQRRVVEANTGKLHTLRVWVKRPAGWRLLVYQEVKSLDGLRPRRSRRARASTCENPCGAVPYTPKNATEREVMKAYKSLEEAAMGGKAREWSEIAADEIALVSSNSDRAFRQADARRRQLRRQLGGVRADEAPRPRACSSSATPSS